MRIGQSHQWAVDLGEHVSCCTSVSSYYFLEANISFLYEFGCRNYSYFLLLLFFTYNHKWLRSPLPLYHRQTHGLVAVITFYKLFGTALGFYLAVGHDYLVGLSVMQKHVQIVAVQIKSMVIGSIADTHGQRWFT